jgi:hypothetical protein
LLIVFKIIFIARILDAVEIRGSLAHERRNYVTPPVTGGNDEESENTFGKCFKVHVIPHEVVMLDLTEEDHASYCIDIKHEHKQTADIGQKWNRYHKSSENLFEPLGVLNDSQKAGDP